jgi:hypothetical protein
MVILGDEQPAEGTREMSIEISRANIHVMFSKRDELSKSSNLLVSFIASSRPFCAL